MPPRRPKMPNPNAICAQTAAQDAPKTSQEAPRAVQTSILVPPDLDLGCFFANFACLKPKGLAVIAAGVGN